MINIQIEPLFDPPSPLDDAVKSILDEADPATIDPDLLPSVITRLGSIRDAELHRGNFDEAEFADQHIERVDAQLKIHMRNAAQRDIEGKYSDRLDTAGQDLHTLKDHIQDMFSEVQAREDEEEERLRTRQREELDAFTRKWDKPTVLRRYTRASANLQACRRQMAVLYELRRYDDLRANSVEIRNREQMERNDRYRSMAMNYEEQLVLLEEKHAREIEVLRVAREGREKVFLAAAAVDIDHAEKRVSGLEVTVKGVADPDRVWNLHHRFDRKPIGPSPPPTRFSKTSLTAKTQTTLQLPPLADRWRTSQRGSRRRSQIPVVISEDGDIS
jgi:hypothetical protein